MTTFRTHFFVLLGNGIVWYYLDEKHYLTSKPRGSFSCSGLTILEQGRSSLHTQHLIPQTETKPWALDLEALSLENSPWPPPTATGAHTLMQTYRTDSFARVHIM